ncbi:hypothetical protein AaE_005871, partial [Aphanomyces astaci]
MRKHLKFFKDKASPVLMHKHKKARIQWARIILFHGSEQWNNIVFSNEKKFLGGPDGLKYYWHDLRKEKAIYSKRQSGGGSVTVWGALSAIGNTDLAFLEGSQDSCAYIRTLPDYLFPYIDYYY